MPPTKNTAPAEPAEEDVDVPTPSEQVDDQIDLEALVEEFLSDLPELLPARRFRISQRHAFEGLALEALKEKIFDREDMNFDLSKPEDIEEFQKLQRFVASIDLWAETIAKNPTDYAAWSEGKTEQHFLVLFRVYKEALGESNSSAS